MRTLPAAVRPFFLLSLLAVSACISDGEANDGTITSETVLRPLLPLIVKVDPETQLYRNAMLAIDIVEVVADGRTVVGKETPALFVGIDSSTQTPAGDVYIYAVSLRHMVFWRFSPDGQDPKLIGYSLPENAEVIEISYRFIDPHGRPAPQVYKLRASRAAQ